MNKEYIIWLSTGDVVKGIVDCCTSNRLMTLFKRKFKKRIHTFNDTEGTVIIDFKHVVAICINDIVLNDFCFGFRERWHNGD